MWRLSKIPVTSNIDYILATLIIALLIYPFLVLTTNNLMIRTVKYTDKALMVQKANVFTDQLLLSYGSPVNWYFSESNMYSYPLSMGLAEIEAPSYILNPFKVMRIIRTEIVNLSGQPCGLGLVNSIYFDSVTNFTVIVPSLYHVPYTYVLNNTGIRNYGFHLVLHPLLTVSEIKKTIGGEGEERNMNFTLKVLNDGEPVSGVRVRGVLLYLEGGEEVEEEEEIGSSIIHQFNVSETDYRGVASLNYTVAPEEYVLLVSISKVDEANYYMFTEREANLSFVQCELFDKSTANGTTLTIYKNTDERVNVSVYQALLSKDSFEAFILNKVLENKGVFQGGGVHRVDVLYEQSYLVIGVRETDTDEMKGHIYVFPFGVPLEDVSFGGPHRYVPDVPLAQRTVRIGECSYRATVYFWRLGD